MNPSFWDERYGTADYAYGREPNDFVRAEAERIPPGPVLCLAEGEGRNAVFLAASAAKCEIHEGPFHGGPSATVQIAARRP